VVADYCLGVRWPCHCVVFAGLAGGLRSIDSAKAAGMAGQKRAVARPPHSERVGRNHRAPEARGFDTIRTKREPLNRR